MGKMIKDEGSRSNITDDQKFELVLDTYRTCPPTMAYRMIGMLHRFNMFTQTIQHKTLIDITSCKHHMLRDFISWKEAKLKRTIGALITTKNITLV